MEYDQEVMIRTRTVPVSRLLPDERAECTLCPRRCKLRPGQRGACFVRGRKDNEVVLLDYGRASGFVIDPIEKKPLNHFYPGTSVLSFGTAGCNLACKFCQNWDISKSRETERLGRHVKPEEVAHAAVRYGCRSIAFTYNDPVIFFEYAVDVAHACRERGVHPVAVTAGYIEPEPREPFFAAMDAANVDLKAFSEHFYRKVCGSSLAPVLDTLSYLAHETSVWLEITTLLIPGENDSDDELHRMCEWIADKLGPLIPLHFTAFHPDYRMLNHPRTPYATLIRARRIAQSCGLQYVYCGNVHDATTGSTWCRHCGGLLIERDWYQLGEWNLNEGRCARCNESLDGHFDDAPGDYGRRREAVTV